MHHFDNLVFEVNQHGKRFFENFWENVLTKKQITIFFQKKHTNCKKRQGE